MKEASLISKLKLTVKTHKPPGKVGHRNIHAADNYALKGLSIWVMTKLEHEIGKYSHMVKSTSQFVKEIRIITPREKHKFTKDGC
jgi:hypothetical protein